MELEIYKLIGKGYEHGWFTNCHARYRLFKGARNTKKSYDILGYEVIMKILSDPRRNVLIVRQTNTSNRYSTFATLLSIISQPDRDNPEVSLEKYFSINQNEMTIRYKPTGQVILFRGLDDAQKLQGIRVVHGYLTDMYIEEAFEVTDYEEFRRLDGSIRGKLPKGLFHQITLCFNSWSKNHWIYEQFFKGRLEDDYNYLLEHEYMDYYNPDEFWGYGKGIYLHISTYKINEFRDTELYDYAMESLREKSLEIYKVEALGMWGNASDTTYPEFNDSLIITPQVANNTRFSALSVGIDTGWSDGEGKIVYDRDARYKSATTMQLVGLSEDYNTLVCLDEYFYSGIGKEVKKTEPQILEELIDKIGEWVEKYQRNLLVYVDAADVAARQNLEKLAREKNLYNVMFVKSTKLRIQTRVDFVRLIMAFGEYKVCDSCKNLIREIRNSRRGENGEPREDFDDHAINANEYAWAPLISRLRRWGTFKQH